MQTTTQLLTLRETAERIGVHTRTLRTWIHGGVNGVKLDAEVIGGRYGIDPRALARFFLLCKRRKGLS